MADKTFLNVKNLSNINTGITTVILNLDPTTTNPPLNPFPTAAACGVENQPQFGVVYRVINNASSPTNDIAKCPTDGNTGLGVTDPHNKLDIAGNLAVGENYAGSVTGPSDGLIIQGKVGIGTPNPDSKLEINSPEGLSKPAIPATLKVATCDNFNPTDSYFKLWFKGFRVVYSFRG